MNKYGNVAIEKIHGHEKEIASLIALNMRPEDKEEITVRGRDPYREVYESIKISKEAFVAVAGTSVLCAFGIAPAEEGMAIWMVATKNIEHHRKKLVKYGMKYIREKAEHYVLYNYIGINNTKALRYIRHAGATFGMPERIGNGMFIKFEIRR